MSGADLYIQIRETDAIIQGAGPDLLNKLIKGLRYRPTGYAFDPAFVHRRWDGWVYMFERDGHFPIGLWPRVRQILVREKVRFRIDNIASYTEGDKIWNMLNPEIQERPYQIEAAQAAVEAQMGIIRAPTGSGKTVITARVIQKLGRKTVILVPTVDLLLQTRDFLQWTFGCKIGQLGAGKVDPCDVTVATVRTMSKVLNLKYVQYKLAEMDDSDDTEVDPHGLAAWVNSLGVLIVDECHVVAADSAYEIATTLRCRHKIGMSASPWRDDNADLKIEAALGGVRYRIGVKELVADGYLVPAMFHIYSTRPDVLPPERERWTQNYAKAYARAITKNEHRNRLIAEKVNQYVQEGRTILLLVRELKHGEALRRLIPDAYFIAGSSPGWVRAFHESGDRARILNQLRNREISCVIASSIADMGLDVPALDTLVLAGGGKSSTRHLQRIGRVCRPYPGKQYGLVVDFDDSWAHLKRSSEKDPQTGKSEWVYRPGWFHEHAKARRRIEREEWSGAAVWL